MMSGKSIKNSTAHSERWSFLWSPDFPGVPGFPEDPGYPGKIS